MSTGEFGRDFFNIVGGVVNSSAISVLEKVRVNEVTDIDLLIETPPDEEEEEEGFIGVILLSPLRLLNGFG